MTEKLDCPDCPGDGSTHVDMTRCKTCDEGRDPHYRTIDERDPITNTDSYSESETEPDVPTSLD